MKKSEQRLALLLGVVLIGGGVMLALNKLKIWKAAVDTRAQEVATEVREAEELLKQREFWNQRAQWLEKNQPGYSKEGEAISKLLAKADELAGRHGITIPIKQPNEVRQVEGMRAVVVTLKVEGEMKPVMTWLHELQRPEEFIAVPALTITPNPEDASRIVMDIRLEKWMREAKS
jgi:hypothetical protein